MRELIGAGDYPEGVRERLTERNAVWSTEGEPCKGPAVQLKFGDKTVKGLEVTLILDCKGKRTTETSDETWSDDGTDARSSPHKKLKAVIGGDPVAVQWKKCVGSPVPASCFCLKGLGGQFHRGVPELASAQAGGTAVAPAGVEFPNLPDATAIKEVTATSTLADPHDAYAAWKVLRYETRGGDPEGDEPLVLWSSWCEGAKDEGLGEAVTITFAVPTAVDAVRIAAGVWRSDKLFAANNRVTALEVIADGKSQTVKPKGKTWTSAKLHGRVSSLVIKLAAVTKGRMNDSCISGIDLVRGDETLVPLIGLDLKALATLPKAMAEIEDALGQSDRKGLKALLELPVPEPRPRRHGHGGAKAGHGEELEGAARGV